MEQGSLMGRGVDVPQQPLAEINGKQIYEFIEKIYANNGAHHVWGVDEQGKQRHLKQSEVLAAYGFEERSHYTDDVLPDGSDNPHRLMYVGNGEAKAESQIIKEKLAKEKIAVAGTGTVAVGETVESPIADSRKKEGYFASARKWLNNKKEQFSDYLAGKREEVGDYVASRKRKLVMGAFAGVALVGGLTAAAIHNRGDDPTRTLPAASAGLINNNPNHASLAAHTALPEGGSSTTTAAAHESSTTTAPSQQEILSNAIDQHRAAMNLPAGSITEITGANTPFQGNIVANAYSFNHDQWHNNPYDIAGARQESQDILNGTNGFTTVDAAVARQNLRNAGMPEALINQLAKGDYSGVAQKFYVLNSNDTITYTEMSWSNAVNGDSVPKVEATRTVTAAQDGGHDTIDLTGFIGTDGKAHVVNFREACGGSNIQSFGNVEIISHNVPTSKTTAAPAKPGVAPTTTAPKETTTTPTTKPGVTTTTRPGVTTTIPETTTTLPGTTTTIPETTTTIPATTTTVPETTTTIPATTTTVPETTTTIPETTTTIPATTTTIPETTTTLQPKHDTNPTTATTVGAPPEGTTPPVPTTVKHEEPTTTQPTVPANTVAPATSVPASEGGGQND